MTMIIGGTKMFYQILPGGTELITNVDNIFQYLPLVLERLYPLVKELTYYDKLMSAEDTYTRSHYLHLICTEMAINTDIEYEHIFNGILEDCYYEKYVRPTKLSK